MIKIIKIFQNFFFLYKNFTFISFKYYKDLELFFIIKKQNFLFKESDFKSTTFKKHIKEFYNFIYEYSFFKNCEKSFPDNLMKILFLLEDIDSVIEYIQYKYNYWKNLIKTIVYSYIIFFFTLIIMVGINNLGIFTFLYIIIFYLIIFLIFQIFYYYLLIFFFTFNYKKYFLFLLYEKLFANQISIDKFLYIYKYMFEFSTANIYKIIYNTSYQDNLVSYKKNIQYLEYFPIIINFLNIFLSIVFIFITILNVYNSIVSLITY
jgi:hypothetical protein